MERTENLPKGKVKKLWNVIKKTPYVQVKMIQYSRLLEIYGDF